MRQAYIYVLHFDEKLSEHAYHYAGCTHDLKGRLLRHANGAGSSITRHLHATGRHWRLGGLQVCSHAAMRRTERHLKDQHRTALFCDICTDGKSLRLPDATQYPVGLLTFPHTSQALRRELGQVADFENQDIQVRLTTDNEPATTQAFIRMVMDHDKDALGFVPVGSESGIHKQIARGLVAIVSNNGQDVGYALFSLSCGTSNVLNVHQCAILDDARLCGHGRALITYLRHLFPSSYMGCKVRHDLAANHFWEALGFIKQRGSNHQTSGNLINVYKIEPINTLIARAANGT